MSSPVSPASSPSVTVLMPAYNDARFIAGAMRSLLAQRSRPFTLLVSDDASTDGTAAIAESLARTYAGPHTVRIIRQPKNLGPFRHYTELVEQQTDAEILVIGCADDIHPQDRVGRLVSVMEQSGADIVCSNAAWIDDKGSFLQPHLQGRPSGPVRLPEILEEGWSPATLGATFAFRRSLWTDTGGFEGSLLYSGGDLWLPLRAALRGGCYYLDEPLLLWRQHARQVKRMTTDDQVGKAVAGEAHRALMVATRLQHYREVLQDHRPEVRAHAAQLPGRILTEAAEWVAHRRRNRAGGYRSAWVPLRALAAGLPHAAPIVDTAATRQAEEAADRLEQALAPLMAPGRTQPASKDELQTVFDQLFVVFQARVRLARAQLRPVWRPEITGA